MNAKREGHANVSGKLKGGKERAKLDGAMRNELELLDPSTKVSGVPGTRVRAASGVHAPSHRGSEGDSGDVTREHVTLRGGTA